MSTSAATAGPAPSPDQPLPVTDRTRSTRFGHRQVTDRAALHDVLDSALVAHVAVVREDPAPAAVVLPVAAARDGESLLLHGSTGGGLLRAAASGQVVTATVTVLDGLVYARTVFDSSMNYRCAVVYGVPAVVPDEEKEEALRVLSEHLMPGRWAEVRRPTRRELAATLVLRLPLEEASVKVRAEGAGEDGVEDASVWAGVLPLHTAVGAPRTGDDVPAGVQVPASVVAGARRLAGWLPPYR
ncbi:pyridoxamine 5'-phosphate oxidase family protein [Quadrisphaera sp. KR29]|uniref:pyridoxamine 5'-phosphate oxidase family protein n=1 Tax=Quadrisphaera sp. KR29 TaxID=3461391 RepID=UPI0040448EC8